MLTKEMLIGLSKFNLHSEIKIKYLDKTLDDKFDIILRPDQNGNPIIVISERVEQDSHYLEL